MPELRYCAYCDHAFYTDRTAPLRRCPHCSARIASGGAWKRWLTALGMLAALITFLLVVSQPPPDGTFYDIASQAE